ncbi:unnamed protein product [Auanema sp. JU1783]|nr:unnamed protein product [Auanema sp. JU1783]
MTKPTPKTSKASIQTATFKAQKSSSQRLTKAEQVELRRLSALLPATSATKNPADMLFNAVDYIQKLEATIIARVKSGSLPQEMLNSLPAATVSNHRQTTRRLKKRKSIEKKR